MYALNILMYETVVWETKLFNGKKISYMQLLIKSLFNSKAFFKSSEIF